jgi:alpha-amylase
MEQTRIPPQLGRYKVFIIDEVHMLSQAAFNAFLKTLEEPPRHAIFILATTEKHKILPTIMSRCQIYDFKRMGVDDIMGHLKNVAEKEGITFSLPSEIFSKLKSVDALHVPDTLSWVDEERDVSCWLGNAMQREAFDKLYSVADRVRISRDRRLNQDWDYLQASNNFRFMTTKPSNVGLNRGIYQSPFDAFTNYMNILGDFINRVNTLYPQEIDDEQLNGYLTSIANMGAEIEQKDKEIERLQSKLEKLEQKLEHETRKSEKAEKASNAARTQKASKDAEKFAAKKTEPKTARKTTKKEEKKEEDGLFNF